jgi:hypothetical protein
VSKPAVGIFVSAAWSLYYTVEADEFCDERLHEFSFAKGSGYMRGLGRTQTPTGRLWWVLILKGFTMAMG